MVKKTFTVTEVMALQQDLLQRIKVIGEQYLSIVQRLDSIDGRLDSVEDRLDNIETRLDAVQEVVMEIKAALDKKPDRQELKQLEKRVSVLEHTVQKLL